MHNEIWTGLQRWFAGSSRAVRLFENSVARGSIATRDYLIRQAAADVLIGLDDDSNPIETDFVTRLQAALATPSKGCGHHLPSAER